MVAIRAVFANDDGIALGDDVLVEFGKQPGNLFGTLLSPMHVIVVHPVPRVVGVYLDSQMVLVAARVGGYDKAWQCVGCV